MAEFKKLINPPIKANEINSESATSGQVLTADGNGGASWQDASDATLVYKPYYYDEQYAGEIANEVTTFNKVDFIGTPNVGDTFILYTYASKEPYGIRLTVMEVLTVGETTLTAKPYDVGQNINGKDGKTFKDIGTFSIAVGDWAALSDATPYTATATKTITLSETIDENCPIMVAFDNIVASVGVVVASATGTTTLTVIFYAVSTPTVEITGTVGGVV